MEDDEQGSRVGVVIGLVAIAVNHIDVDDSLYIDSNDRRLIHRIIQPLGHKPIKQPHINHILDHLILIIPLPCSLLQPLTTHPNLPKLPYNLAYSHRLEDTVPYRVQVQVWGQFERLAEGEACGEGGEQLEQLRVRVGVGEALWRWG